MEQVTKTILYQECRYLVEGHPSSADWHYAEAPFYVYVEVRSYGHQDIVLEFWWRFEGDDCGSKKILLPNRITNFEAIRSGIEQFDVLALRLDKLSEQIQMRKL